MTHGFHSHCPVVRRGTLRMVEFATVGGERKAMPFEREVLWIRKSESKVMIWHRGVEVDDGGTYCDHQLGTSIRSAIEEAIGTAKHLKIDDGPTPLSVEVWARLFDYPALAAPDEPTFGSAPPFRYLPREWCHADPVPGEKTWPANGPYHERVEEVEVEASAPVWSSERHDLDEAEPEHVRRIIERWRAEAAEVRP